MEYQEYYAEEHQVDEYPSGEMYQGEQEEPGRMAGFIDSIKTIESDIRAKLTAATEEDEEEEEELIETEEQGEEQSLFQKLTGIEISSPFSHNDEEEKTNHTEVETQEHESDSKSDKSFFDRLTRFDGKKEEGYNVQSSAISADDAELKNAPKVSNMVALFEQMKGKKSQRKTSTSDRVAMEEIDAEKRKAKEKFSQQHEEPGLLDKLSHSFSFTSDEKERETEQEEKEEEEVIKDEESTGLLDRLRKFSLATNPSINDEQETHEVDEISEVDEVSEPSLLDQFTTSIKNTFTTETTEDDSIGERITDDED